MAPAYNPENAPVFFVGIKGDVTIKDEAGNEIKLKKGDKIPVDARIIVGDGGKIVFKQENKTLKYESQGEASLSNALTASSDASQDPGIDTLVEAAEQIITTPDRPSQAMPVQQPLAKPVTRADASTLTPTPAKEGILEPPFIVPAYGSQNTQPDASDIVKEMAEQIAAGSDALRASTTESEEAAGKTLTFEYDHKHVAHDETPLPPAVTGQVDSKPPALEFDNPASNDNYNFVTYNKTATITGTATPGQTFTLTQGNNSWKITADDKGTWSQAVTNLKDGLTEFSASTASIAGVEVHKTAKLLVQSTPYDFKIQPDTGISDTDNITHSEDLLLTVKSQPDATVVLTILGKDIKSTVNKDGQAEFKITLAGDNIYTCQLKTLYANNGGESDTVEETITLDTTPAVFNLDQLQTIYKDPDISFSGQCNENGSTVSIRLVNVFNPGVSVSTTTTVENGTFKATATVPEQGQYRAEVTVVDVAGNPSFPQDYPFEYQPPKPELIIQTRPEDSSGNANPEWTGTFPHEGKLEISFAGKTDTITVKDDNTWSYQFSDAFNSGRHTVTFTGSQTGLAGTAIEQDSFSVVISTMTLRLDAEPADRIATTQTEWKGSGAAPNAKVTLTLKPIQGSEIKETVTADSNGAFVFKVTGLTETSYTPELSATATGYQDGSLTGKPVTVDITGPRVEIIANFQLTAGTSILRGKALNQYNQLETKGSVIVKVSGIPQPFTDTFSNGYFSVQIDGLQPGKTYDISLTASDELQNAGPTLEKTFSVPGVPAPPSYDFAVTSDLKSDTNSIVIKGTHPLENGRVLVNLSGYNISTTANNGKGIITGRAKNHEWSVKVQNLLLEQEITVRLKAMDDAGQSADARLLPDIPEIQDMMIIGGRRDSYFDSLSDEPGIGTYGKHICIPYNNGKFLDKSKSDLSSFTLTSSDRADIKYKIVFDSKLPKGGLLPEYYKPSKLYVKSPGLKQLDTYVVLSVETPSLHYTFDNFQPGQDSLISQAYPAIAKISGSVDQVQGSIGSGLQLGKGVLQIEDFKDLFKGSYTICFDIKTSAHAIKGSQLFPALAGYYDETSPTGAKTHLFGAINEKGQIGVADHNSGFFAEPVVADGQWHSVCISRTLKDQGTSTYRMLVDGKQADISINGGSVVDTEVTSVHGTISNSPVSEYPVELLGGVTKSNSPDQVEYLNAVLDNFTAYPINMETPYESLAYAHVHWNCSNGGACFYNSEFPAGLMIKEMMESRLTPHNPLYLQLKPDASKKSLGTGFTVKYMDKDVDPQDASVAGDNVYKLDNVCAKSLATVSVQPADPAAAHKFELHFDRTESDLIKGTSMPDGIIKFDSSMSPLGSGISFGVGKEQSYSPSNKDPNLILEARHLILEARHLVTEPDTTINNYDIRHSIIDLNGLHDELKVLTQTKGSDSLLQLMKDSTTTGNSNQVKLMHPCTLTDPTCTTEPLVTINTIDHNPAIALTLNGETVYF